MESGLWVGLETPWEPLQSLPAPGVLRATPRLAGGPASSQALPRNQEGAGPGGVALVPPQLILAPWETRAGETVRPCLLATSLQPSPLDDLREGGLR